MRAIFISYRREDAEGQAGRLFDDLARHFGEQSVFMDVAGIAPGRDFRRVIDEHVASCGVLLSMIGKSWIDAKDASGQRRLDDAADFVRLETASALKRDIPVIPVLVHGAQMPRADQLPPDLAELAYRNGIELTHARWDSDVQVLIKALSPHVELSQKGAAPPPAKGSMRMVIAAAAVLITVAVGGFAWSMRSSQGTEGGQVGLPAGGREIAENKVDPKVEADRLAAQKQADAKAAADKLEAEKQAAAREAAEKLDAQKRADAKTAAEHRARWPNYDFPPPNGGLLVFTIMPDGNPACASYDGGGCLWGQRYDQIDFSKLKPLVCGEGHRARWGVTGYEDPKHWCNLAKTVRGNRS